MPSVSTDHRRTAQQRQTDLFTTSLAMHMHMHLNCMGCRKSLYRQFARVHPVRVCGLTTRDHARFGSSSSRRCCPWRSEAHRLCLKKLAYGGVAVMLCKHQGSPTLNRLAPVSPRLHITTHARVRRGSRWPESRKQRGWCGAGRRVRGGRFTSSSTRAHRS